MNLEEFEAALQEAFAQCEVAGFPLQEQQKQILLQTATTYTRQSLGTTMNFDEVNHPNPLEELTPEQRQVFLQFVEEQNRNNASWKVQLLNDWLQGRDSGPIQFIRELYGLQWLDRVQPIHLAQYLEETSLRLKVGDRIEVSNNLWEWVQDDGPCSREWFPCTIIAITEAVDTSTSLPPSYRNHTNCIIRFDSGVEYEIQGVYEWNRYNWRWL